MTRVLVMRTHEGGLTKGLSEAIADRMKHEGTFVIVWPPHPLNGGIICASFPPSCCSRGDKRTRNWLPRLPAVLPPLASSSRHMATTWRGHTNSIHQWIWLNGTAWFQV